MSDYIYFYFIVSLSLGAWLIVNAITALAKGGRLMLTNVYHACLFAYFAWGAWSLFMVFGESPPFPREFPMVAVLSCVLSCVLPMKMTFVVYAADGEALHERLAELKRRRKAGELNLEQYVTRMAELPKPAYTLCPRWLLGLSLIFGVFFVGVSASYLIAPLA